MNGEQFDEARARRKMERAVRGVLAEQFETFAEQFQLQAANARSRFGPTPLDYLEEYESITNPVIKRWFFG